MGCSDRLRSEKQPPCAEEVEVHTGDSNPQGISLIRREPVWDYKFQENSTGEGERRIGNPVVLQSFSSGEGEEEAVLPEAPSGY